MQVHVVQSELAVLPVDAVVVPTNSTGRMSDGLALQVRHRAGPAVEEEAVQCAPIAVGAAVVTSGGGLYARHVIHVPVVEEPGLKLSIESVRRATRAALLAAAARSLEVIALPFMGRAPSELTNEETARGMADELRAFRGPCPATIYLADPGLDVAALFEEALRAVQ